MAKFTGYGAILKLNLTGGAPNVVVGQVQDISGIGLSRDTHESTTHDSLNATKEFLKGLKDGGSISFTLVFDPVLVGHADATGVLADFNDDKTIAQFSIELQTTPVQTWTGGAIVETFNITAPVNGILAADVSLKTTAKWTIA